MVATRWRRTAECNRDVTGRPALRTTRRATLRAMRVRPAAAPLILAILALVASCKKADEPRPVPAEATDPSVRPAPSGPAVTLVIAYGSEKKTWLEESARAFEASGATTKSGKAIRIEGHALGSGEAQQAILDGSLKPHVYSPASGAYLTLLDQAWAARPGAATTAGAAKPLAPPGDPVVLSPIVIAMWKPMAETLGWPGKAIGWADIIKISRDPRGWAAVGHPEWGAFKLGHTHPEFSNSGLLAVLAEAYAGAGKQRDLTAADLASPKVRDFMAAVEGSIVHYGKSTGFFADKLLDRGPAYMSAAVLYENLVIESYAKKNDAGMPLVAVYPLEGTFWSDHPYSILDAEWVGPEEREAAQAFLAFLKARPQQERALALGFRPADPAIAIGAPVDAAHGCDAKQPETLLDVPSGDVLTRLLALWKDVKKPTDVILVFDKSGSMRGHALEEAKQGAKAFLGGLHDRDEVSILFFDSRVYPPTDPGPLGERRAALGQRIDQTIADGGTALYDATLEAYETMQKRAKEHPARIHAVVVMTDGRDEDSKLALEQLTKRFSPEAAEVKIFTIAYGDSADPKILAQIAEAAQGTSARGSAETIVQVYRDLSAFF
jgi:Ca-activated chloride channel family protein